jgi:hypothetical protein
MFTAFYENQEEQSIEFIEKLQCLTEAWVKSDDPAGMSPKTYKADGLNF